MSTPPSATVTTLLQAARAGDPKAVNELFPLVYDELYDQARRQRRQWPRQHTINTTALVHEAYLKLVDQTLAPDWSDRAHFLGVAAKVMRHVLIDYARKMKRQKRGGDVQKVSLEHLPRDPGGVFNIADHIDEVLALGQALDQLTEENERAARVVECRYFAGLTIDETAQALDLSPSTVKRDWVYAQAWLYRAMTSDTSALS